MQVTMQVLESKSYLRLTVQDIDVNGEMSRHSDPTFTSLRQVSNILSECDRVVARELVKIHRDIMHSWSSKIGE